MERVVIFNRVSMDNNVQNTDRQQRDNIIYCERNDLEVVKEFSETISGLKDLKDRFILNEMLEFVLDKNNCIDAVVCTEISRLGRKLSIVLQNVERLADAGISVITTANNPMRTLNPDKTKNHTAFMLLGVMGSFAAMEREITVQRSKSGILKGIVNNQHFNSGIYIPYGYKKENKRLVINEEERGAVELIFQLSAQGKGCKEIANQMNLTEWKCRRNKNNNTENFGGFERKSNSFVWTESTIWRMLKNGLFAGIREKAEKLDNKGNVKIHVIETPAIISKELFLEVNEQLKKRMSNPDRTKKKYKYIFKNEIIRCGVCGKNYYPIVRTKGNATEIQDSKYRCISRKYFDENNKTTTCGNVGIGIERLQSSVWYFLRRTDELQRTLERTLQNSTIKQSISELENNIEILENDFNRLERKQKSILELKVNDLIEIDDYTAQFTAIRLQKTDISTKIENRKAELKHYKELELKQLSLNEMLVSVKYNPEQMKKLVENIVNKLVIYPVKESNFNFVSNKETKVFIELHLLTQSDPILFCISQRSDKIIKLIKGEYNYITNILHCGSTENRIKDIIHFVKLGV